MNKVNIIIWNKSLENPNHLTVYKTILPNEKQIKEIKKTKVCEDKFKMLFTWANSLTKLIDKDHEEERKWSDLIPN